MFYPRTNLLINTYNKTFLLYVSIDKFVRGLNIEKNCISLLIKYHYHL